MTELAFHRLAAIEMRTAYGWYAARNAAVASRFLQNIDQAIARVINHPDSHPIDRKHFRWVRVRRFPYSLIFEHLQSGRILIVAIAHANRRPGYWSRRR